MRSATDPEIIGFEIVKSLDTPRNTVFRAREISTGDDAVVKLLDPAKEPILPKRFDRHRRTLTRLCGLEVGFVPLLDHGLSPNGRAFVVSPYYPIGSLQDQLDQGPMPWHLAAELVAKVAEIVGHAHDQSVVLGDLRPSSVLLEAVRQPVVAAMGMATRRFDDGTPDFSPPEQHNIKQRLTPAADVYSLSLVFGALIGGEAKKRSQSDGEFLEHLRPLLPTRFFEVIAHGLAPSPTNRYRDANTMERAIRQAIEADPDDLTTASRSQGDDSFDFDEILFGLDPEPTPMADDEASGRPADSLPPGLEDIVFVARDDHPAADDGVDLSLPAGLEDLKLVSRTVPLVEGPATRVGRPSTDGRHGDDETQTRLQIPLTPPADQHEATTGEPSGNGQRPPNDDGSEDTNHRAPGDRDGDEPTLTGLDEPTEPEVIDLVALAEAEAGAGGQTNGTEPATGGSIESMAGLDTLEAATTTLDLDAETALDPKIDDPFDGDDVDHLDGGSGGEDDATGVLDLDPHDDDATGVLDLDVLDLDPHDDDATGVLDLDVLDLDRRDDDPTGDLELEPDHEVDPTNVLVLEPELRDESGEDRPLGHDGSGDGDQTTVLEIAALQDSGLDDTSVLTFDHLTEGADGPQAEPAVAGNGDPDHRPGFDYTMEDDPTTVLDLAELERAAAETGGTEAEAADLGARSEPADRSQEPGADNGPAQPEHPAPPTLPTSLPGYRRSSAVMFAEDSTDVFGDPDDEPYPPAEDDRDRSPGLAGPAMAGPSAAPFVGRGVSGEEIPFTGITRVRNPMEPQTWLDRTRIAAELAWFRSRRSMASVAAVLGLLAIAGIALFFLAKEIRSNVTEAEGVPLAPTTVTSSPDYVPTDAPYVTDPPQTNTTITTTTAATPRRRARSTAPPTTAAAATTAATIAATTATPPSTAQPPGSPRSTIEVLPTTGGPKETTGGPRPTTSQPATTVNITITVAPPPTSATAANTKGRKRTTTAAAAAPSTNNGGASAPANQDLSSSQAAALPATALSPTILSLDVIGVNKRSASISYTSDQCVATRFTLSGVDGTVQHGSSPGFDPAVRCSQAWNLDFDGSWGLRPATSYVLQVWIKGVSGRATDSAQVSFSTTG